MAGLATGGAPRVVSKVRMSLTCVRSSSASSLANCAIIGVTKGTLGFGLTEVGPAVPVPVIPTPLAAIPVPVIARV